MQRPKVLAWRRAGRIGSCRFHSSIAQPVEHLTVNQAVAGSNPARGANFTNPWGDWGIAKSVKARDFDSRIRWFESNYPSQCGSLAQLAEHLTFNQGVPGSNPG